MKEDKAVEILSRYRYIVLASAIMVFILIVAGGMVRASDAAGACPDWPTCLGSWSPPLGGNALINYLHRLAAILAAPLILISARMAWIYFRRQRLISIPVILAAVVLLIQVLVGAWISLGVSEMIPWVSIIHLGLSLLILACLVISIAVTFYWINKHRQLRIRFNIALSKLSLLTTITLLLLLISGAVVTASGSSDACPGWPLCDEVITLQQFGVTINLIHRIIVALTALLLTALFYFAWRNHKFNPPVIVSTTAVVTLFLAQALLGARIVSDAPAYLLVLHQATATAVWAAMITQLTITGLSSSEVIDNYESTISRSPKRLLVDLLALTKPIVVILLLVTTYAGMVIGAQAWPPFYLTLWTLVGGFLAAGGSGAINQYIDRYDDRKMQRTQNRPLPSGRLTPGEGLAFGVAMTLTSFYVMVAFVNIIAALLTLAGIIYYVLLYSIFLKKTTVQNIVIGGGAGAIPPLVGWAAATGSLNVPSLFLFAIIFMWTPPHFWALALVRRKDYARAGVPMMPVVRGEKETRWQILIYTIELIILTLVLPLFGLGGAVYLIGAVTLGLWLLASAWKVWKQGGNKQAWKMYRFSSMYLAFLFIVLMIDRLI